MTDTPLPELPRHPHARVLKPLGVLALLGLALLLVWGLREQPRSVVIEGTAPKDLPLWGEVRLATAGAMPGCASFSFADGSWVPRTATYGDAKLQRQGSHYRMELPYALPGRLCDWTVASIVVGTVAVSPAAKGPPARGGSFRVSCYKRTGAEGMPEGTRWRCRTRDGGPPYFKIRRAGLSLELKLDFARVTAPSGA